MRAAIAFAALLTLPACGDGGGRDNAGTTTTTSTPHAWQSCEAPRAGYALDYPADWHTNSGDVVEPCHWFDDRPFELAPATDVLGVAVYVRMVEGGYEEHARRLVESRASRVLLREARTVAGRDAIVVEVASTGVVDPPGSRAYTWFVAADDRTLMASTAESALRDATRYDQAKPVIDRMMSSVRFTARPARCSADGLSATPERRPALPDAVAETRRAIVDAATRCDYARLAELASSGRRPFTASFGGADDVGAYWQRAEAAGERPMHFLVGLLDTPHARQADNFVWPSAHAADRWSAVPPEDREALRPLYGDDDFQRFERFGSYAGYRVGVAEDGEWLFFVAGD